MAVGDVVRVSGRYHGLYFDGGAGTWNKWWDMALVWTVRITTQTVPDATAANRLASITSQITGPNSTGFIARALRRVGWTAEWVDGSLTVTQDVSDGSLATDSGYLPPQVAIEVIGETVSLRRRARKWLAPVDVTMLDRYGRMTESQINWNLVEFVAYPSSGFFDVRWEHGVYDAAKEPSFLPVVRTKIQPGWRTQRRRTLDSDQDEILVFGSSVCTP